MLPLPQLPSKPHCHLDLWPSELGPLSRSPGVGKAMRDTQKNTKNAMLLRIKTF